MSDSYVCSGAMMKCTMGTSPAKLTVRPTRTMNLTGQPQANISDHKTMVNLAPFGLCRSLAFPQTAAATAAALGTLTPTPCLHNTPMPWMGGKMDYLIKGQPALLKSSTCQCMWGGTISLVTDGQVGEGTWYVNKKGKDDFGYSPTKFVELKSNEIPSKNSNQTDSLLSDNASVNQIINTKKYKLKEIEEDGRTIVIVDAGNYTVDINKFNYFFGKVTSSKKNAARSKQNKEVLSKLGITNEQQLMDIFDQAINTEEIEEKKIKEGITKVRKVEIGESGWIEVGFFYINGDMKSIPKVTSVIPKTYNKK